MVSAVAIGLVVALAGSWSGAQVSENLLRNPSFEEAVDANGFPTGWGLYAGNGRDSAIRLVEPGDTGKCAVAIEDGDPSAEIGLTQNVPAKPGLVYQASVRLKGVEGASSAGAYLQLRFLPSNQLAQVALAATSNDRFEEISVKAVAPDDTQSAQIYLYTHRDPTPEVIVDTVQLVSGVEPPPPPPPQPVPPVYAQLKDQHLVTELVRDGKANIAIVAPASGAYQAQAAAVQQAIAKLTGETVPVIADTTPEAAVPISRNLIVLGNRSTSKTAEELYNRYYLLTDLRYPGPEGYEVRTLHNPFGNGCNVIVVGGSDAAGVASGARVLIDKLNAAGGKAGALSIGWLMEITLGKGIEVPKDLKQFETWEASAGYGSSGYFGWSSLSKRLAIYYMTGDPFQAREFIRLAFPDEQVIKELSETDGEMVENKNAPLSGPYHYNAHMMILFWDLCEESPVFTDEERLRVTNAFSKQLEHRRGEGIYGRTEPPPYVGSRHGQYAAISLYCLGRYFQKDYPNPIWQHCMDSAALEFAPLRDSAWVSGENDNLFWYNTATAPILSYMLLSGDRAPLTSGNLPILLKGQEMLISGRQPDWALSSAALDYLHKTAYLTHDGRWLTYRDRTGVDLSRFRLGQSYWPEDTLAPSRPEDLVGKWSINPLPAPMWRWRGSGLPFDESVLFGSYRSATDASGDFVLVDGFNGASRNPYHTFAILELRINGNTLLQGYRNQVLTRADGLVEPQVAMDAALKGRDVVGQTAYCIGEVPNAAYCGWKRTLVQRTGRYALLIDDLGFRADAENMDVQTLWETTGGDWDAAGNALQVSATTTDVLPPGWVRFRALESPYQGEPSGEGGIVRLDTIGIVLLRATQPGNWLEMTFRLPEAVTGEAFADLVGYVDRGAIRLLLDGEVVVPEYDHYAATALKQRISLGQRQLAAGEHRLRIEVVRRHEGSEKCYIGLGGVSVRREGAAAAQEVTGYDALPCDLTRTTRSGSVFTMEWTGPVKSGEHRLHFSLIAPRTGAQDPPACLRLASNAAALRLPEPAVAFTGEYEGSKAEFALIAQGHLFARAATELQLHSCGSLVRADVPVDIDWDFGSGTVNVVAPRATRLALAMAPAAGLTLDGKPAGATGVGQLGTMTIPEGRHVIAGAGMRPEVHDSLVQGLAALATQAQAEREKAVAAAGAAPPPTAPPLIAVMAAKVAGEVVEMVIVPSPQGPLVCAAEGKTVHVLSSAGQEVRSLQADGSIRVLRWWAEHNLLLVGCVDEKVIAFDLDGNRKWVFTSEMDPAVFAAAKQYWFKSAPGHEGIHGLFTGVFLDGKSQCFVGSACTLEIIDENGKLVKRLPVFWGQGYIMNLIDGPEGSLNLLIGRRFPDGAALAIINNRTLDPNPRGFDSVPPGHTYVGGWSAMNRHHIFYEDLEGDGAKEVVSEITGTWNRVTVWQPTGEALYDASFGPGESIPARNIRDLDLADLDGDGKKGIVVATSSGLVVALSSHCEKLWAKRLSSPPTVLQCASPVPAGLPTRPSPWIIVGCEDGSVMAFDSQGSLIRLDKVSGRPTCIQAVPDAPGGPVVVIATSEGEVKGFRVGV